MKFLLSGHLVLLLICLLPLTAQSQTSDGERKQKLDQDPTKVITKFGISYSDDFAVSGSFAFDPVRKINFRLKEGLDEWRIGGSWLFSFGIVNINFGKNEFDGGGTQTNYSIGTFAPLSKFGIAPWDIQMFPMAGYTYNEGEIPCDIENGQKCKNLDPKAGDDLILGSNESHSGYLGLMGLKQISDRWTAIAVLNGSLGTNDYSGLMAGTGLALQATKRQSFNLIGIYIDNSYGQESKAVVAYSYQFN
jgi:hypothetical protein